MGIRYSDRDRYRAVAVVAADAEGCVALDWPGSRVPHFVQPMPGLVVRMLEDLQVQDGRRVPPIRHRGTHPA